MKKYLCGILFFFSLLFTVFSCDLKNLRVKSIYLKPVNEEIFDNTLPKQTYYFDGNKKDIFMLSATFKGDDNVIYRALFGKIKIDWFYKIDGGPLIEISEWIDDEGDRICKVQGDNLSIDMSRINTLASYTIIAKSGNNQDEYRFDIDSKGELLNCFDLYFVSEIGAEIKRENRIDTHLEEDLFLCPSCTYAIVNNDNSLGKLRYFNNSPESLILNDVKGNIIKDKFVQENVLYISTRETENTHSYIEVDAGSKKHAKLNVLTTNSHNIKIDIDPPLAKSEAVVGGIMFYFKSSNIVSLNDYNVMIQLDNNEPFKADEPYYNTKGEIEGYSYFCTSPGKHSIKAYFQKANLVSDCVEDEFEIMEYSDVVVDTSKVECKKRIFHQEYDSATWYEKQKILDFQMQKNLNVNFSRLPFSENCEYIYPFKETVLNVKTTDDDVKYYELFANKQASTVWNITVDSLTKSNFVDLDLSLKNNKGIFGDIRYKNKLYIPKMIADAHFEYLRDDENNKALYMLRFVKISHTQSLQDPYLEPNVLQDKLPDDARIYFNASLDGGKTYSILKYYDVNEVLKANQIVFDIPLPKEDSKTKLRAMLVCDGYTPVYFDEVTTASLKTSTPAIVDYSQSVQDKPNIKKARIKIANKQSAIVLYSILPVGSEAVDKGWNELLFSSNTTYKDIEVIKYDSNESSTYIEKNLWIKTIDDKGSMPSIKSYTVSISRAPRPLEDKSVIWKNKGFWGHGITLNLTAPEDNCYVKAIAETENANTNSIFNFSKKGDTKEIIHDWDQCFASYRYNRFYIAAYTRLAGHIDSEIVHYCGFERSGSNKDYEWTHTRALNAEEKLKETWRCTYEFK